MLINKKLVSKEYSWQCLSSEHSTALLIKWFEHLRDPYLREFLRGTSVSSTSAASKAFDFLKRNLSDSLTSLSWTFASSSMKKPSTANPSSGWSRQAPSDPQCSLNLYFWKTFSRFKAFSVTTVLCKKSAEIYFLLWKQKKIDTLIFFIQFLKRILMKNQTYHLMFFWNWKVISQNYMFYFIWMY